MLLVSNPVVVVHHHYSCRSTAQVRGIQLVWLCPVAYQEG